MEEHAVHRVPKGRVALAANVQAAEAGGGTREVDALPRELSQGAEAADTTPRARWAHRTLQQSPRRREGVDLAEHRQSGQLALLSKVEHEPLIAPAVASTLR